jgi:hypothetical protein
MEGAISKSGGNASLAPGQVAGEGRVSTARWNPKGLRRSTGPESMGATPGMNRSAKEGVWSSRHSSDEGVSIHPSHQGVCGRHGAEEHGVTPGGLVGSPARAGVSNPISGSEVGREARPVVGPLHIT